MLSASSSRPGPASARSARAWPQLVTAVASLAQTVSRESFSRPLTQNGVAERFPDWTAVGFRARSRPLDQHRLRDADPSIHDLPDPFLGSRALRRTSSAALARWVRRFACRGTLSRKAIRSLVAYLSARDSRPRVTGGDSNPTCHWALASPLVSDGL